MIFTSLLFSSFWISVDAWVSTGSSQTRAVPPMEASSQSIDWQSDTARFGRGEYHLSAILEEGDVVAYQTGQWEVDGVLVGEGTPETVEFCQVENLQLVWTHNCEHGVVRGWAMKSRYDKPEPSLVRSDDYIEFGPEQLIARIPVHWVEEDVGVPLSRWESDDYFLKPLGE